MPKKTKEDKSVWLQQMSQCAYDIFRIVQTLIDKPGVYKELQGYYFNSINTLGEMMKVEKIKFKDSGHVLPEDLLFLSYRDEADMKVIYKAEKNLKNLIYQIENKRKELLGNEYKPKTGVEDLNLKGMLENVISTKSIAMDNFVGRDDIKASKDFNTVFVLDDNKQVDKKELKGKVLLTKGKVTVNLGQKKNGPYKLFECLYPFGTIKLIDTVFKFTHPKNGKYSRNMPNLTIYEKIEVLKSRFKELQKLAKELKLSIGFNVQDQTVYINMK
jgi:hypothetical protein